jgi:hypothetical protein
MPYPSTGLAPQIDPMMAQQLLGAGAGAPVAAGAAPIGQATAALADGNISSGFFAARNVLDVLGAAGNSGTTVAPSWVGARLATQGFEPTLAEIYKGLAQPQRPSAPDLSRAAFNADPNRPAGQQYSQWRAQREPRR